MYLNQTNPFSDQTCYHLNGGALGDLVAAAPVIKYAIEHYHNPRNCDYRVALFPEFEVLFPYIPKEKFISLDDSLNNLSGYCIRKLNTTASENNVARLTPSKINLTSYASINLLGEVLPLEKIPYVPLAKVNVDHFGIDFDKAVVIIVTYRDECRYWLESEIIKTAEEIRDMGLIPVYVGKTGAMANWKKALARTDFVYPGFGIDLIDKTSIPEMYSVMAKSRAVLGMDSGPIHIAMATNTPVICGFTNIRPELRIPDRGHAITIPIIAEEIICRFCQSDWNKAYWDYTKCPRSMAIPECVEMMTAEKFIKALHTIREP